MLILGLIKGLKTGIIITVVNQLKGEIKQATIINNRFVFLFFSLARELCFTGRRFTAQEAKEFGFVRCVSDRHFR